MIRSHTNLAAPRTLAAGVIAEARAVARRETYDVQEVQ
jgi:hypothetical protein